MREIVRLIVVLTLFCVVGALALAKVHDVTKEPIALQRRLAKLRAVEAVLPEHDNDLDKSALTFDLGGGNAAAVYIGTSKGIVTGFAFEVKSDKGYSGDIVAMLGLDPNGAIYGVEVIKMSETPGLGAKITTPEFRLQFKGKSLNNTRFMLKKDGGDMDQVTGATISPRALVKAIRDGLEFFASHKEAIMEQRKGQA
jgi:electron transport complex protein RnfG